MLRWTTQGEFAALVKESARAVPAAGRFHDKAFLHAVWAWGRFGHLMPLEQFKAALWDCHRAGLLELSRADMVEAMDPHDVRRSTFNVEGATFNFIRIV